MISGSAIEKICPGIKGLSAVFSEETGILSAGRFVEVLQYQFREAGGLTAYNARLQSVDYDGHWYHLTVSNSGSETNIRSECVINAAGLNAVGLCNSAGIPIQEQMFFCKGHYYKVCGARRRFEHLVYPLPDITHLGTHVTVSLDGELKLGPDAVYLQDNHEEYGLFLTPPEVFLNSAARYWPEVRNFRLSPEMTGIRPKLYGPGDSPKDFIIREESELGFPGWINLLGIESPGLTAALAFAPHIADNFDILRKNG